MLINDPCPDCHYPGNYDTEGLPIGDLECDTCDGRGWVPQVCPVCGDEQDTDEPHVECAA